MKKIFYLFISLVLLGFSSCGDDDDVALPTIAVNFTSTTLNIDKDETSKEVAVNLSRVATVAIDVTIKLESTDVAYGTAFTTDPVATDNLLKITIPAGSSTTSFKISKVSDLFDGSEKIKLLISALSTTDGVKIGDSGEATLVFGTIISTGEELTLEGKTEDSNYTNSVYVDFSTNTQYPINRMSWTLGFYSGNEYRVILSTGNSVAATSAGKADINAVTLADAEASVINAGATGMMDPLDETAVDNPNGLLTGTAFKEVAANDSENMVYYVTGSEDKGIDRSLWYKVKVNRSANGYSVQYARVNETNIKTVEIAKDAAYNIVGLDLATGNVVKKEPKADKWDIMWGYNTGISIMNAGPVAAFMQDNVLINNLGGVEVGIMKVATVSDDAVEQAAYYKAQFDAFKKSDISTLTFASDRSTIGTGWREVAGMGATAGIKMTHFYIVKDPAGNYYKLRFKRFGVNNDGAERGRPQIEYKLVN